MSVIATATVITLVSGWLCRCERARTRHQTTMISKATGLTRLTKIALWCEEVLW